MRHAFFASSVLAVAVLTLAVVAQPAIAQSQKAPVDQRVDRLEKEMKAVQRKVFPAGVPIEAEVVRPVAPTVAPGSPASTPVSDLMARVGALESQMASMTGQIEETSYKLKQLEDSFAKYRTETESRLLQPETPPPVKSTVAPPVAVDDPAPAKPVAAKPALPKPTPPVAAGASEERKGAVAATERPDSGDAADDAYAYGFRLWDAKFYPEAQAQLKATVDKYGATSVASRAQNLLGRSYLDDGKPALASVAFYENYQKRPRGERAPDSLAWLGEALIQLKKPADACKVYAELDQVYGETLSSGLRGMMDKGKARAKCTE